MNIIPVSSVGDCCCVLWDSSWSTSQEPTVTANSVSNLVQKPIITDTL